MEEIVFPMKKSTSVIQINKDDVSAFTVDENESFILDDSIGGSKLELQPVSVQISDEAQEQKARNSPVQFAEQQDIGNEDTGERFTTPEQEFRRSTRVTKISQRFEHFATVTIEDLETMEEATESSNKERWQKPTKK